MKKDKNAMKIITEVMIKSIIMKKDHVVAENITLKENIQRLITEKKDVKHRL